MQEISIIILISGFVSILSQTILLRELLVIFGGNELTIGVVISHWLLGTALGSYLVSKSGFNGIKAAKTGLAISFIGMASSLAISIILSSEARNLLSILPGEAIPLSKTLLSSFALILPASIFIGGQFSFGVMAAEAANIDFSAGRVYILEAFGFVIGGIFFTFIIIPYVPMATCVALVFLLCAVVFITLSEARPRRTLLLAALLASVILSSPVPARLNKFINDRLYRGYEALEVTNSNYGQTAVLKKDEQRYVFYDNVPVQSFPYSPTQENEEFAALPFLFGNNPKKLLVMGGAFRVIPELLSYNPDSLDYLEQDPVLLRTLEKNLPPEITLDKRFRPVYADPRNYLADTKRTYDAILIGLPFPMTLSANRFFTQEFFGVLNNNLSENGFVAMSMPGSPVYITDELGMLNLTFLETFKSVFPNAKLFPGDNNLIIAQKGRELADIAALKEKFKELKPENYFLSAPYIEYRFDPQKVNWFFEKTKGLGSKITQNKDLDPQGLLYSLIYWQSIFEPSVSRAYEAVVNYSWITWILIMVWFLAAGKKIGFNGTAFSSGFAGFGLQMVCIWGLQAKSGNIYYLIAFLSSVFMFGLALGSYIGKPERFKDLRSRAMLFNEVFFVAWILLWFFQLELSKISTYSFFFFSLGTGMVVGFEFPLLTSLNSTNRTEKESHSSGRIYAFDLLGGWLAAILLGGFLIPAWGLGKVFVLILLVKLVSLIWWASFSWRLQ